MSYTEYSAIGVRKIKGNSWSLNKMKIKNKKIVFSTLFFSY